MISKTAMKTLLSLVMLSLLCMNSALAERQFDKQKMDDYLSLLSENNKAILSIEIVEKGKLAYQNQTGVAYFDNQGNAVKPDAQTQYRVGSITKMFTATLIMQLIEQNKLSLNTPLATFFPEIQNADVITIDHLLMHRSGIVNYTDTTEFWQYFFKPQTKQQMLQRFTAFESLFKPGTKYSYSNTNYMLLGYIIENITKQSYEAVLQNNIIAKLNLKNTQLGSVIDTSQNQAQSFYYSQSHWQIKPQWHMSTATAAGAIISTPHDLNIFINALMAGELVSKTSTQQMLSQHYGKGIAKAPFYERYSYGHTGLIEGFYSVLGYFPTDDVSLAINVNGLAVHFNNDIIVAILSIYFDRPYSMPDFSHPTVELDEQVLIDLAGEYRYQFPQNPTNTIDVSLFVKEGQLWGKMKDYNNPEKGDLQTQFVPSSDNSFWSSSEGIKITFTKKLFGGIKNTTFKATQNGRHYLFRNKK